jgi:hypothetical protein
MIECPLTKTSFSDSGDGMGIVVSEAPPFAEKRGAGGSGLRGLPPYWEEGVPGRGLPLISGGSYCGPDDRVQSVETLDGVDGLIGDRGLAVGNGMEGARPRLEFGRELYTDATPGR